MRLLESIAGINDMFCHWRKLGNRVMAGGTEFIGPIAEEGEVRYLHVLYSGLSDAGVSELEASLGVKLPRWLRSLYLRYGGMDLWSGAFIVFGLQRAGVRWPYAEIQPSDILRFNHWVSLLRWSQPNYLAFAQNSMDMSVFLASLGGDEILRCDINYGQVIERFDDVYTCLDARLNRVDRLVVDDQMELDGKT